MKTRLLIGSALVLLILALFVTDALLEVRACVSLFVCLLGLAGWYEFAVLSGITSRARGGSLSLTLVGFLGTAYFLALGWRSASAAGGGEDGLLLAAGVALLFFGAFLCAIFRPDHEKVFQPLLATLAGVLLLGLLFSYTLRLYHLEDGTLVGLVFFLAVKGGDIAAYFVGRAIGRVRFLKVSPRKTLEGCLAAVIFSVAWFVTVALLWEKQFFSWSQAIPAGIILSITSQVGDLSESLIKRAYQVKDSAVLLPEFGGVLDMIDSTLFSGFVFWCFLVA